MDEETKWFRVGGGKRYGLIDLGISLEQIRKFCHKLRNEGHDYVFGLFAKLNG
jgi:hypothetical protein